MSDWRNQASCAAYPVDWFFPEQWRQAEVDRAKTVCEGCPVMAECREEHIWETDGIFFATTPRERRNLRRDVTRPLSIIVHGTVAGYNKHRRRSEEPCAACRLANAVHSAEAKRKQRMLRLVVEQAS